MLSAVRGGPNIVSLLGLTRTFRHALILDHHTPHAPPPLAAAGEQQQQQQDFEAPSSSSSVGRHLDHGDDGQTDRQTHPLDLPACVLVEPLMMMMTSAVAVLLLQPPGWLTGLSDFEVRFFLFELLRALDWAHSRGVMHRDVKNRNVIIDTTPTHRTLR